MNTVTINWHEKMSNAPGKSYIGLRETCPPNATTPPHRHGGASVAATVIKGRVLNQMICPDGTVIGPQVYETGESWFEAPGCHHVQCRNAGGEGEEAVFVAGFVVDGEHSDAPTHPSASDGGCGDSGRVENFGNTLTDDHVILTVLVRRTRNPREC